MVATVKQTAAAEVDDDIAAAATSKQLRKQPKSARKSLRKAVRTGSDEATMYAVGDRVWAKYADGYLYTATVAAVHHHPLPPAADARRSKNNPATAAVATTCDILYDDNETESGVRVSSLRRVTKEPERTPAKKVSAQLTAMPAYLSIDARIELAAASPAIEAAHAARARAR